MPIKELINEWDEYIIVAGLLLPLVAWTVYTCWKRAYSVRSVLFLVLVWSISLALLGRAFMREVVGVDA